MDSLGKVLVRVFGRQCGVADRQTDISDYTSGKYKVYIFLRMLSVYLPVTDRQTDRSVYLSGKYTPIRLSI